MNPRDKTRIVLVLHCHLPYVRIPEKKFPLQELWLFQAITESYIPLIFCFNQLIKENINFKITLSVSPTLISMLADDYYKTKYREYLKTLLRLLDKKKSQNYDNDQTRAVNYLSDKINKIYNYYNNINGDLSGEFKKLSMTGNVNLVTTAATHAVLPLFRFSRILIDSQINYGQTIFKNAFGFVPEGFWLPELAYYTDLDMNLSEYGIRYTFLEANSVVFTKTRPVYWNYYPSVTNSGLLVFPRDLVLSNAIWSSKSGYPGDFSYREFHFDNIYSFSDTVLEDLGLEKIPFGLKIYKITGNDRPKEYYDPEEAMTVCNVHAQDFINKISQRSFEIKEHIGRHPLFTLPFDAELFGHWWHEGPEFLKQVITGISKSEDIELVSPADVLNENLEKVTPAESSWGRGGFFESWTNPESTWIYPEIARLETMYKNIEDKACIAANQALKEIMLASSSDWTFFISNDTSRDFGKMRLQEHIDSARKILNDLSAGITDFEFIKTRNEKYPVF